jgi:N-methylhydantoinase A/oxoprolinase/acetone carboxylase beta subunit
MEDYAEIGGHKTYIPSLDVRTAGVAGGSMVRLSGNGSQVDVGPRSAHIAGLPYVCFTDLSGLGSLTLELIAPSPGDQAEYICLLNESGKRFALTTACAANLLGFAKPGDYAYAGSESALAGFTVLAHTLGISATDAATSVLEAAVRKLSPVVEALLTQYGLDKSSSHLVGGGGGAAAIVPCLAKSLGMTGRLARSHEVISPIGVALAMVREVVERTIVSPTPDDLLQIRREAVDAAARSGASPLTVQVTVEVDSAKNLVRAIAVGATEMVTHDTVVNDLPETELRAKAAEDMGAPTSDLVAQAGRWRIYRSEIVEGRFLWKRTHVRHRVVSTDGVIVLAKEAVEIQAATGETWPQTLDQALSRATRFGDAGAVLPETYLYYGSRQVDLSGSYARDQIHSLASAELAGCDPTEPVLVFCTPRT